MAANDGQRSDGDEAEKLSVRHFLDADELEAITGTPASTWRNWARNGYGPPRFKIGRRWVWRTTVVQAWLEAQEAAGA